MTEAFANTFVSDLRTGLHELMEADDRVYLIGEDLVDPYGGAFGVTRGISTKFPDRVLTTPISEAAITGTSIGMSLRGLRPIIEIMFGDFITLTMDQLVNVASKMAGMYSGAVEVPIVVRAAMGGGRGYGPTHSQTLDKLLLGIPGLTLIAPSIFHSPGDLLRMAVTETTSPIVFTENKLLYPAELQIRGDEKLNVQYRDGVMGFKTAIVSNHDNQSISDITVIGYGGMSLPIAESMRRLADEEINITAVIPSAIDPFPVADLIELTRNTAATLVIEEGVESFGWGAEVTASLAANSDHQSKIFRLGASNSVIPAARHLENDILPTTESITAKLLEVFEWIA